MRWKGIFRKITIGGIFAATVTIWKFVSNKKEKKEEEQETNKKEFRALNEEISHNLAKVNDHEKLKALFLKEFYKSKEIFFNNTINSYVTNNPPFQNFSIKPQSYQDAKTLFYYEFKKLEDVAQKIYQGLGYFPYTEEKKIDYTQEENNIWNDIQHIKGYFSTSLGPLLSWSNLTHSVYFVHIEEFPNLFLLQQDILNPQEKPRKFGKDLQKDYQEYANSYLKFVDYYANAIKLGALYFSDSSTQLPEHSINHYMVEDPLFQPYTYWSSIKFDRDGGGLKDKVKKRLEERYPRFQDILIYFLSLHTEAIERSAYAKASPLWKEIHDIQEYLNQRLQTMDAGFSAHGFFIKPRP